MIRRASRDYIPFFCKVIGEYNDRDNKLKTVSYHLGDNSLVFRFISGGLEGRTAVQVLMVNT